MGGTGADPATQPYAYLNYLVFDNNYVVKDGGAWRVPATAGFDPGMEISVTPQQVKFPSHIKPQQKGYIYIWVSNESENTKVWFDDLKVTHTKSRVVQASDYYAWGSTMREQRTPENDTYRYGYQGEFAEKDLETGWNHFELREYDAVIGRWLVPDPMRQYWSPYTAYGNNPVNVVDPRGGEGDPVVGDIKGNKMYTDAGWVEMLNEVTVTPNTFSFNYVPNQLDALRYVQNNETVTQAAQDMVERIRARADYHITFTSPDGTGNQDSDGNLSKRNEDISALIDALDVFKKTVASGSDLVTVLESFEDVKKMVHRLENRTRIVGYIRDPKDLDTGMTAINGPPMIWARQVRLKNGKLDTTGWYLFPVIVKK